MSIIFSKINARNIFIVYLIGIVNFVIVKYFGNIQTVLNRITSIQTQREEGNWNIRMIPFRTIASSIDSYIHLGMLPSSINFIANIVVFIPMGFLIPLVIRRPSLPKTFLFSLLIILLIETIQFVTCLGAADIDDVILNMVGCMIGYLIYVALIPVLKKRNNGYGIYK
jgi:glycopeptide antibiotics resistance protein